MSWRSRWARVLAVGSVAVVAAACGGATTGSAGPSSGAGKPSPSSSTTRAGGTPRTTAPSTATSASRPVSTTTSVATTTTTATTTVPASTTTPATTVPGAPPATTTPATTTPAPPGAPAGLTREAGDLAQGSKGTRTWMLQTKLHALKYDVGEPDGAFGLKTAMAVWAYQGLHGLRQDGVVKPLVELAIQAEPPAAQPMLRPDLGPDHTEVDLDRQVLLVFRGGTLQLVTHVSTGSGRHYCDKGHCGTAVTPPGDFRYQRRISGWRVAPLGKLYNPVYFNGGIAVHGAPSVPDHPASHGCVRIPMHIAEYFPSLVANGDAISVFHGGSGPTRALRGGAVAPPGPATTTTTPPPDVLAGD